MKLIHAILSLAIRASRKNPEYAFWFFIVLCAATASYICHLCGI